MQIQTSDYPTIVNDTGNGIMLSTSYYLYHYYLLPYKALHAPHMLARTMSFSKSTDWLWDRYNANSYKPILILTSETGLDRSYFCIFK